MLVSQYSTGSQKRRKGAYAKLSGLYYAHMLSSKLVLPELLLIFHAGYSAVHVFLDKLFILYLTHFHITSSYVDCLFFQITFLPVNEIKEFFFSDTHLPSFKTWDL